MKLEDARANLKKEMAKDIDTSSGQLLDAVNKWFHAYKKWEEKDTFEKAFREERMTGRTTSKGETKKLDIGEYLREEKRGQKTPESQTIHYNGSMKGILKRIKPENFKPDKKNKLGLHDASAVLLSPQYIIKDQLVTFNNPHVVVYMPLPQKEDHILFHDMNELVKKLQSNDNSPNPRHKPLYEKWKHVHDRFTRILYGSSDDMHVGLSFEERGDGRTHIRYGKMEVVQHKQVNDPTTEKRRENAKNYNELSRRGGQVSTQYNLYNNDVTVKYREHAGVFPVFWVGGNTIAKSDMLPHMDKDENVFDVDREEIKKIIKEKGKKEQIPEKKEQPKNKNQKSGNNDIYNDWFDND